MAQNDIALMGAVYPDVPAVTLPIDGGGTAKFTDVSDTTASASDVAQGKYFYTSSGVYTEGTASGGGAAVVVTETPDTGGGVVKNITAVDISNDTVDAAHLLQGYTAHDSSGNAVTGSYVAPSTQTKTATPTESQQTVTPDSGYLLSSVTVDAISSTYVGSGITRRSSSDLSASGATVTVPSGYYSSQASKAVTSGSEGTPTATKGSVSNHSVTVTPSVTNTAGYISGGTKTGTAVTVSASELVSGSETITENDTYDVTNLSEIVVDVPSGGGSVTVTDEPNATGITCVITSGGSPVPPTPSDIPLNTQLIDFTKVSNDMIINSQGQAVSEQWYAVSDYTVIDSSMSFTAIGCRWFYIGFYDENKDVVGALYIENISGTVLSNTNLKQFSLSSNIPSTSKYCRISTVGNPDSSELSLIRTA